MLKGGWCVLCVLFRFSLFSIMVIFGIRATFNGLKCKCLSQTFRGTSERQKTFNYAMPEWRKCWRHWHGTNWHGNERKEETKMIKLLGRRRTNTIDFTPQYSIAATASLSHRLHHTFTHTRILSRSALIFHGKFYSQFGAAATAAAAFFRCILSFIIVTVIMLFNCTQISSLYAAHINTTLSNPWLCILII
jgi:hypothetical protein